MTDLTERLNRHLLNDDAEQRWLDADNLIEEALAEIQSLRAAIFDWARDINAAEGILFLRGSEHEPMIIKTLEAEAARRGSWDGWI